MLGIPQNEGHRWKTYDSHDPLDHTLWHFELASQEPQRLGGAQALLALVSSHAPDLEDRLKGDCDFLGRSQSMWLGSQR